ncbi:MAG TPA: hypothetical protein VGB45_08250 [Abditibacterium sp.]
MENSAKKRLGAGAVLLFLSPALVTSLSGCNRNRDCDEDGSTLTKDDDCGTGRRTTNTFRRGGGGSFGPGLSTPRSGGFGGFGRWFSGGS